MIHAKLKMILIVCFAFFHITEGSLKSESKRVTTKTNLSMLYEALGNFPKPDANRVGIPKFDSIGLVPTDDSSRCNLQRTNDLGSVQYYGIRCDGVLREGLISFYSKKTSSNIPNGYFKILGREKIGNKHFLKIALGQKASLSEEGIISADDVEFEYDKKQVPKKNKVVKREKREVTSNANLTYFRTIAFDKNRRKSAASGLEIFFDHTCPLKFKEVDESFYWDNTISYVFEISCVKNSPYGIVRVPGNKKNKLVASNHETDAPQKGDSFLARLKLRKITNEMAYWEDFKLYYE